MSVEDKLQAYKRKKEERLIISLLKKYGTPKASVEQIPHNFADRLPEQGETYWYYNGPLDDKTRSFCRLMLKIDKVFSQSEIDRISDELGYDVLVYCGSYNCRHQWIRFIGKRINTPVPTSRQIRKLINDGIEA